MSSTSSSLIYKIRRSDGLFSMGGSSPRFSKRGKVWKRRCDLTAHLNLLRQWRRTWWPYADCLIAVYPVDVPIAMEPISPP